MARRKPSGKRSEGKAFQAEVASAKALRLGGLYVFRINGHTVLTVA